MPINNISKKIFNAFYFKWTFAAVIYQLKLIMETKYHIITLLYFLSGIDYEQEMQKCNGTYRRKDYAK